MGRNVRFRSESARGGWLGEHSRTCGARRNVRFLRSEGPAAWLGPSQPSRLRWGS
jgi:hypothetical protein